MAEDKRITENQNEWDKAVAENNQMYSDMISQSDKYYNKQIDASKEWAETQKDLQQDQTDFTIEQINQQKDQAKKDYTKEQSGAYVDWQKQSNQYGVNAEKQASSGLTNTGFSESSQVSMYNAYQARVTAARETYSRAVLNYDNAIKDARLQNNAILAEIAYEALKQQLELSLQGFQYKNTLVLEKAKTKREINSEYYQRYLSVLSQINTENALAEEKRQFNEQMAFQKEQFAWQKAQAAKSSGSATVRKSSGGSSKSKSGGSSGGGSKVSKSSTNKVDKSGSDLEVDMSSVLALGYGPISASKLNSLVAAGSVVEYVQDGKIKYKKSNNGSVLSTLMNTAAKNRNF